MSKYAIFTVKGVQYSAPSQFIGHRLMVRQYAQHIRVLAWWPARAVVAGQRGQFHRHVGHLAIGRCQQIGERVQVTAGGRLELMLSELRLPTI